MSRMGAGNADQLHVFGPLLLLNSVLVRPHNLSVQRPQLRPLVCEACAAKAN